tara:strand:+ start:4106 stop:4447 length:342 start_codon:yes stop_codon:yes gene_type:complete
MPIHKIIKMVHLDKFTKCYKNIFSISNPPDDNSLNLITNIISKEKLSPFHTFSSCCDNHSCLKVFINKSNNQLLKENEIDVLFSQLIEAGFKIEYEMSKLINEKNFICFISKN